MAAGDSVRNKMDPPFNIQNGAVDNLKRLYPGVDEKKAPLPRAWSAKEKFNYIGLSQNNLRVHYKGHGKTHRDAASVQATHPIPPACGLYYFEVKIVSKGRDGYMGIGLSAQGVNMNRLPGWDKQSYGYHGDDGHSFCSSGTGQPYGPTFTTGDVIGCGVNLIENTCFYTKNGHNLGTAFTDLPPNLYPTVGLQTPGEVVDANFGQEPFVFDIEDMLNELRSKTRLSIYDFAVPESQGEWQNILNSMVSSYLIHHGYCNTAEAFAHITNQPFEEDIVCIKNRKRILRLVLSGRMSEAIEKTYKSYPGLLECNQNLLFMLKCRQFVEMVNGSDIQACTATTRKNVGAYSPYNSSSRANSPIQTSVIQSTKNYSNKSKPTLDDLNNQNNSIINGSSEIAVIRTADDSDIEMDTADEILNGHATNSCNGKISSNGYQNGNSHSSNISSDDEFRDVDEDMDIDNAIRKAYKPAVERILEFGRELNNMNQLLKKTVGPNDLNDKMLEDAFSLLAYSNPWSSPVGWQLAHSQRESISASLNSAILYSQCKPRKPPLEIAMAHAQEVVHLMSNSGLGSCAFASVSDLMEH